ncbi:MAG: hypothetical protein ILA15_11305 [Clostridiales bacterium]|nr:hypothetical protein [Clostridiales bacterium]
MKLRNFLYLNTKILEDYISAIDGYTYDEESQAFATSNENAFGAKAGIRVASGSGEHKGRKEEEIKRSVKISDAARFDKIYQYLNSDEEGGLQYYECLNDEIFNDLQRDDFLEVLVTVRFSKMKALSDGLKRLADMESTLSAFTDQAIIDAQSNEAINGIAALSRMQSGKGISCVFEFEDKQIPLVASLDEDYFRCEQDNFVGQAYLLCKVIKKIPEGQSIELDGLFDDLKKIPIVNAQKPEIHKNMNNPVEVQDIVKGPALKVLPIAFYQ